MEKIEVRLLRESDDRSAFTSGHIELDRFFHLYAGQNRFRHHLGSTYGALGNGVILGYVTVALGSNEFEELPEPLQKKLPRYPLPILRLVRLAVGEQARGHGVGKRLMRSVFELARELSVKAGCVGVVVDAKPEAIAFYEPYGFEPIALISGEPGLRPVPTAMFLPVREIPA